MAIHPSAGGGFSPSSDYNPTGNWTWGTSTTKPTCDFTNATVKGVTTSGSSFVNATLTGATTIGAGATLTSPALVTPTLGAATATSVAVTGAGTVGYGTGAGGTITQITSSSTGVTINKPTGTIVTVALTTAAGAHEKFTVTNSFCAAATDVIVLSTTYAGGASHGTPVLQAVNVTAGTFDLIIANVDATNALNAAMTINFAILSAVAA